MSACASPIPVTPSSVSVRTSTYSRIGSGRFGVTRLRRPPWWKRVPAPLESYGAFGTGRRTGAVAIRVIRIALGEQLVRALEERDEQRDGRLDVVHVAELHGRVHVPDG